MERNPISYSFWLTLDSENQRLFQKIITNFSLKYKSPNFYPHITLLSGFLGNENDLIDSLDYLSNKINNFKVYVSGIRYLDENFRSLFLDIKKNDKLEKYHILSAKLINHNQVFFEPHLSLIYGLHSLKDKKKMIDEIGKFPIELQIKSLCLAFNNELKLNWRIIKSNNLK